MVFGTSMCWTSCSMPLAKDGVGGKGFAIDLEIVFVQDDGAGIDEGGHGRGYAGAPVFEFANGVVVQVVEKLQPVVAHDIRFLRDRDGDGAAVDPIECVRIVVEGDDGQLAFHGQAVKCCGGA